MEKTRTAAYEKGDKFYQSDRACKNGHVSPRYVSGGNCVDCLALLKDDARKRNQSARHKRNATRYQFVDSYARTVPIKEHTYMDILRDIFLYGSEAAKDEARAYLDVSKLDRFASPIHRPAIIDANMSRSDALAFVSVNESGQVLNAADFDYAGSEDQDPYAGPPVNNDCIRMNGKWYKIAEVIDLLHNKRASIAPATIAPDLIQIPMKAIIR